MWLWMFIVVRLAIRLLLEIMRGWFMLVGDNLGVYTNNVAAAEAKTLPWYSTC